MHLCTCTHNRICTRSHDARKHKHAWHTSGATGGKGRAAGSSGCRGSCTQAADQRTPGTPPRGPSPSRRHRPRSLPLFPSFSLPLLLLPPPFSLLPLFAYSLNPTLSASLSILLCTHTRMVRACKPVQCRARDGTQTDTHSHITKTTGEGRSGVGRMGGCATVLGSHQQARIRRPVPAAAKRDPAGSCRHLRPRLGESASDLTVCPVWPLRCLAFKSCPYCSAACA